jgi:hypothetical protein
VLKDTFDENDQKFNLIGDILKDLMLGIFEEQINGPKYRKQVIHNKGINSSVLPEFDKGFMILLKKPI